MTRGISALLAIFFLAILVLFDLNASEAVNPYNAAAPIALGSGQGSVGALCSLIGN